MRKLHYGFNFGWLNCWRGKTLCVTFIFNTFLFSFLEFGVCVCVCVILPFFKKNMKAPARRSVSYVVEGSDEERAHRLGVNSLVIDPTVQLDTVNGDIATGGILYSAGRDGVVASWDLHVEHVREQQDTTTDDIDPMNGENTNEGDQWIFDQGFQQSAPKATCRAFSQTHTDWVNDIALCENGRFVVSASSDRTVKLWSTYEDDIFNNAHTIGWHTDYVKCLASAERAGWVASSGLDKRIKIWDIERCQATLTAHSGGDQADEVITIGHTATKASIYAMATNPSGTILATGSPDKVVRLWDPRSGKQVGKLTGHTDNIRALLISEDGSHILSGSSDSTIKYWSARAQRCLATYETHNDSVWSLFSDDPELRTFYAGSRDGLVTRTEVSGHGDMDTSDESECIGLFKEKSGVAKIAVLNDTYVWTATSSSDINRWLSIPSRESRQLLTRSTYNIEIPLSASAKLPPPQPVFHSQYAEPFLGSDNLTLYARSVMSIPISYHEDDEASDESIQPLRSVPDCVIKGKPGISTHLVLQNRRHVLAKDTNGEVSLWDVVKCAQVKNFGQRELDSVAQSMTKMNSFPAWCSVDTKIGAITVQLDGFTCFDCEMYADEIDLPETYEVREDQRINLGKWVLAHLFSEFLEKAAELHEKEEQRYEALDTPLSQGIHSVEPPPSQQHQQPRSPLNPVHPKSPVRNGNVPKPPLSAITTNIASSPFHPTSPGSPSNNNNNLFKGPFTAPPTTNPQQDYFSGAHHVSNTNNNNDSLPPHSPVQPPPPAALSHTPTSPTSSNFINKLKHLSVKAKISKGSSHDGNDGDKSTSSNHEIPNQYSTTGEDSTTGAGGTASASEGLKYKQMGESGRSSYTPPVLDDFPPLHIPRSTTIIIAEESAEASTGMDLYRGTVGTAGIDADLIAQSGPSWLLDYLYHNKIPNKDTVKLTFSLKPYAGSKLPQLPAG
ncbi:WD40-repeat-containing domain protein [Circinella umbellata]|nr:WD40-repeat-containing domain protein [Circinella umbellata]